MGCWGLSWAYWGGLRRGRFIEIEVKQGDTREWIRARLTIVTGGKEGEIC